MLVGEGPGEVEDRTGRPFQGPAGQLLDRALAKAGIERDRLWVTNTVKSRSADPAGRRMRNRPPLPDEVAACRTWLDSELEIVRPSVIVCLGASAAEGLIGPKFKIGDDRSSWFPGPLGSSVMATYHPSYPLRLHGETFDRVFGIIVDDLARAWRRAQGGEA
jgi:DNA polymerase